jgi:hypothetical protein
VNPDAEAAFGQRLAASLLVKVARPASPRSLDTLFRSPGSMHRGGVSLRAVDGYRSFGGPRLELNGLASWSDRVDQRCPL